MELREALRTTGAIREFDGSPVDRATVYDLIETARFAPSGGNRQGWRVVLVEDPATRRALRDLYLRGWYEYLAIARAGLVPFAPLTDRGAEAAALADAPAIAPLPVRPAPGVRRAARRGPRPARRCWRTSRALAAVDRDEEGYTFVGGASVYPFAWSILLAAHDAGLGGVMTTMARRRQADVLELLGRRRREPRRRRRARPRAADGARDEAAAPVRRVVHDDRRDRRRAAQPLSAVEQRLEVLGQRRGDADRLGGHRVREAEHRGVQEDPALGERGLAMLPVAGVVHDRTSDRSQVHPDLVGPAGLQAQLEQRARRRGEAVAHLVGRPRGRPPARTAIFVGVRWERPMGASITPAVVGHVALDEPEVAALDGARLELGAERRDTPRRCARRRARPTSPCRAAGRSRDGAAPRPAARRARRAPGSGRAAPRRASPRGGRRRGARRAPRACRPRGTSGPPRRRPPRRRARGRGPRPRSPRSRASRRWPASSSWAPLRTTTPSTRTSPPSMSAPETARVQPVSIDTARSTRTPSRSGGTSTSSVGVVVRCGHDAHVARHGRRIGRRSATRARRPSTPKVIATSARLNAGQCGSVRKSTTPPVPRRATRSTSLPRPPPSSRPKTTPAATEADPQRAHRHHDREHDGERDRQRRVPRDQRERNAAVATRRRCRADRGGGAGPGATWREHAAR